MASEWRDFTVAEIAAPKRNALVGGPFGSNLVSADYADLGVPVIRGQNMGQRWVTGEFAYVTEEKARSLEANLARPGDIVFTQRGTLGQVSLVPAGDTEAFLLSQSQMKLTPDASKADTLFLYYIFTSAEQQDYVRRRAIQTGVPHTNLGILKQTPISLPSLEDQKAISSVLGTLDDKIELNRKMNEMLEGMARALFKSWFVDFDPVHAKAEGRPTGLPASIAALFPDSFEHSELGEIPKGWGIGVLDNLAAQILGGDWGEDESMSEKNVGVRCIRGADIPDLQRGGTGKMPYRYLKQSSVNKRALNEGDLVVEISGGSPTQSTGRPVLVSKGLLRRLDAPLVCSNFCRLLKLNSSCYSAYIYLWLLTLYANDEFLQLENGTTGIKNLAFSLFSSTYKLVLPAPPLMETFNSLVSPFFLKLQANGAETESLTAIRDALLPKLISGEVRVKDSAGLLEASV